MQLKLLISLAMLTMAAEAFQSMPIVNQQKEVVLSRSVLFGTLRDRASKQKRRLISKVTVYPLAALTQLKRDETKRAKLAKMGISITGAFLATITQTTVARAATPLVVSNGAVTPLITTPGLGVVDVPGMKGHAIRALPNREAAYFVLSLFVATALISLAGDGHIQLMRLMNNVLGKIFDYDNTKESNPRVLLLAPKQMTDLSTEDDVLGKETVFAKVFGKILKYDGEKVFNPRILLFEPSKKNEPRSVDWGTYSHSTLDTLQKKRASISDLYTLNPHTLLFESRTKEEDERRVEEDKLRKTRSEFFQEQQYKQHHHPVHSAHSKNVEPSYLNSLSINEAVRHDMPKGYLDTLSTKLSSWNDYKLQLDDAQPMDHVEELKEEVTSLQDLMAIEQSMYQASNHALKLAMDAKEVQRSPSLDDLRDFDTKLSTNEELKEFDKKAKEYQDTIMKETEEVLKGNKNEKTNL